MSVDVVCAGAPFLDITFTGLRADARAGRGAVGRATCCARPAAVANIAIGADPARPERRARGRRSATTSAAALLRGARWPPRASTGSAAPAARTPSTVVMPLDGERAMRHVRARRCELDTAASPRSTPRAVVDRPARSRRSRRRRAASTPSSATTTRARLRRPPAARRSALRARCSSTSREARVLTGARRRRRRPRRGSAERGRYGHRHAAAPRGALAPSSGGLVRAHGARSWTVVDTTGAGDLFTAAFVWADLAGRPPRSALRWAVPMPRCRCAVADGCAAGARRAGAAGSRRRSSAGCRQLQTKEQHR